MWLFLNVLYAVVEWLIKFYVYFTFYFERGGGSGTKHFAIAAMARRDLITRWGPFLHRPLEPNASAVQYVLQADQKTGR